MKTNSRGDLVLNSIEDFGEMRCCNWGMWPVIGWWAWSCPNCGTLCYVSLQKQREGL